MTKRIELLRVLTMLKAAGWSSDQITRFYAQINEVSLRDVVSTWRRTGEQVGLDSEERARPVPTHTFRIESAEVTKPVLRVEHATATERSRLDAVERAATMLKSSGVGTSVAVTEVSRLLRTLKSPSSRKPPTNSRKSLRDWLDKVSRTYSPSELLFAAAAVAKKHGDTSSPSWRIRSDDSPR